MKTFQLTKYSIPRYVHNKVTSLTGGREHLEKRGEIINLRMAKEKGHTETLLVKRQRNRCVCMFM